MTKFVLEYWYRANDEKIDAIFETEATDLYAALWSLWTNLLPYRGIRPTLIYELYEKDGQKYRSVDLSDDYYRVVNTKMQQPLNVRYAK